MANATRKRTTAAPQRYGRLGRLAKTPLANLLTYRSCPDSTGDDYAFELTLAALDG